MSDCRIVIFIGRDELHTSSMEKDLGVFVDDRYKFQKHVSHAVNKASRILGMIRATLSCLDKDTVSRLYKALVRPHLEYGSITWHPRYRVNKLEVDKVQTRATKLVAHFKDGPYESRLKDLKLHSRRSGVNAVI